MHACMTESGSFETVHSVELKLGMYIIDYHHITCVDIGYNPFKQSLITEVAN